MGIVESAQHEVQFFNNNGEDRPRFREVIVAALGRRSYENTMKLSETLIARLKPDPVRITTSEVAEQIIQGSNLFWIWPHRTFWDIPVVFGTSRFSTSQPYLRAVVGQMPPPVFPPESIPVQFRWEDIYVGIRSSIPENRAAAYGNFLLSMALAGGAFRGRAFKDRVNAKMVRDSGEHILQGGNIALWPSGPGMIGPARAGGARIIDYIDRQGGRVNIINVHLATSRRDIERGLVGRAKNPIVTGYFPGPTVSELKAKFGVLGLPEECPLPERVVHARAVTKYLSGQFFEQRDEFLDGMSVHGVSSSEVARMRDIYDYLIPADP